MASDSEHPDPENEEATSEETQAPLRSAEETRLLASEDPSALPDAGGEDVAVAQIGVQRYVHASFLAAGILAAYLSGKVLESAWNSLAEWPAAVGYIPFLLQYTEEDRGNLTLVIGAVVGVLLILRYYRRPAVRNWATAVATELARVTWPNKDTVTNGTIVVLIAGAIATLYIALLDRLWGYLTNLVYGA